jgi:catechol 2,3-dioxygenase-like lactoylglutathione lyase family enzyme
MINVGFVSSRLRYSFSQAGLPPGRDAPSWEIRMKRLHLALGVRDIAATVTDYSRRLGQTPSLVIPGEYALWRTAQLNVSVRLVDEKQAGQLRHLGWEDDSAEGFSSDVDCNGILWELFDAREQAREIHEIWPEVDYTPNP